MNVGARQRWASLVAKERARPRRISPRTQFRAKHPYYGPIIFGCSVAYFLAQFVVAQMWRPSYSWLRDSISSLGITSCDVEKACSPGHAWMNSAFFLLGVVMAAGSWFIFGEFTEKEADERLAALVGFWGLGVGGAGAVLVGLVPENSVRLLHIAGAILAIGVGTLGIWVLGFGISRSLNPRLARAMRYVPPLAILAGILFGLNLDSWLGHGAMERLAAYPETVWLILFGIYIGTTHHSRTRGSPVVKVPG